MTSLGFLTFTYWNSYVFKLLRLETLTSSDVTLSDINVVWCYVLSQYPEKEYISGIFLAVLSRFWRKIRLLLQLCWSSFAARGSLPPLKGSPWQFSPRSWSQHKSGIQLLIGNSWLAVLAFAFRYMLQGLMDLMFFGGLVEIPSKVFYFHCILPFIYFLRWILFFILKTTKKDKQSVSIT